MNIASSRQDYLYQQYLSGRLSAQERSEWKAMLEDLSQEDSLKALMDTDYEKLKEMQLLEVPKDRNREILAGILSEPRKIRKPLWSTTFGKVAISVAASIVLAIGIGGYIYYNKEKETITHESSYANDVAPGREGATLTLANGKKIRLSDAVNGQLASEAGVVIRKAEDGELVYEIKNKSGDINKINTLSTANGETYRLRLPDGSTVWLNAASSLTYSANLIERGKRKVRLSGEGYFEIAKDKAHPFVVETDKQQVEVLGTHFNVNAYQDEPVVATTLLEGSVKLSAGNSKKVLKPGEQGVNNGSGIKVLPANLDNITDWKEGDFNLDRIDFRAAMRKIERWYDVEVIYDDSVPHDLETGGWISRDKKLSNVLRFIEKSGLVHFRVDGRKVYVTK